MVEGWSDGSNLGGVSEILESESKRATSHVGQARHVFSELVGSESSATMAIRTATAMPPQYLQR